MSEIARDLPNRILIASANPLFALGLQKMVIDHRAKSGAEVRLAGSMDKATAILNEWQPELVIVDYDDLSIKRAVFLNHFISSTGPLQVMLVSLRASGEVVVFDRRVLTTDQAEEWLDLPRASDPGDVKPTI